MIVFLEVVRSLVDVFVKLMLLQDLRVMALQRGLGSILRRFREETFFSVHQSAMSKQQAMSYTKKHGRMLGAALCGK
jgi:hypothetical protein